MFEKNSSAGDFMDYGDVEKVRRRLSWWTTLMQAGKVCNGARNQRGILS